MEPGWLLLRRSFRVPMHSRIITTSPSRKQERAPFQAPVPISYVAENYFFLVLLFLAGAFLLETLFFAELARLFEEALAIVW